MSQVTCPYCQADAELTTGKEIYPHRRDLYQLRFWICRPCKAHTGTHKYSKNHAPKGRLANADLRKARSAAHRAFDPLWRDHGMHRSEAYEWLREAMGWERQPHIGFMDVAECERVIELSRNKDEAISRD